MTKKVNTMKLTRQAQVLIFAIMVGIFLCASYLLLGKQEQEKPVEKQAQYTMKLVLEDTPIVSTYIDSISQEKSSSKYQKYDIEVTKGTKIKDYTLSANQTFSKYIQPLGPNGKDKLIKGSKNIISHYAYSMLLKGDILKKTNLSTKEKTYEIVNAYITYNQIPLTLLSDNSNVSIANQRKTKEKIVNLQEFIDSLKSVDKRDKMLTW